MLWNSRALNCIRHRAVLMYKLQTHVQIACHILTFNVMLFWGASIHDCGIVYI